MREFLNEETISQQWDFNSGLRFYYYLNIRTKKPAGKRTEQSYFEKVCLEEPLNEHQGYLRVFSLTLKRDDSGRFDLIFEGREDILRKFIAGTLESITKKEHANLPLYALAFLQRKGYTCMK